MAKKEVKEKLKELTGGISTFKIVGFAKVDEGTFSGAVQKEGKLWLGVNDSISIKVKDGVQIFTKLMGGYRKDVRKIKVFKRDGNGMMDVDWEDRKNEDIIKLASNRSLLRGNLRNGDNGHSVMDSFLSEIDFEAYLKENLKDGDPVRVSGTVDYSVSKDGEKVYRNYNIQSVFRNESYEKNGELHNAEEPSAVLHQTYLLTENSLPRKWEKELTENGEVFLPVHVPQYIGKKLINGEYREYKKTDAIEQVIKLTATPEELKTKKFVVEKLLTVGRGDVRELGLIVDINEGYSQVTGVGDIPAEVQELIDMGIMTEEEVTAQTTITGTKVSELIYKSPIVRVDKDTNKAKIALDDEKYSLEALVVPEMDEEIDDDDEDANDDTALAEALGVSVETSSVGEDEDPFANIFG